MEERINEKEIICVICPNSCRLTVYKDKEGIIHVIGNQCARGVDYGKKEYTEPERMLITTMRIKNAKFPVIPVRSDKTLPKEKLISAVKVVNDAECHAPIIMGQVLITNILDTGVNVVASRNMKNIN